MSSYDYGSNEAKHSMHSCTVQLIDQALPHSRLFLTFLYSNRTRTLSTLYSVLSPQKLAPPPSHAMRQLTQQLGPPKCALFKANLTYLAS